MIPLHCILLTDPTEMTDMWLVVITLKKIVMSNDYYITITIYNAVFQKPLLRSQKIISLTEESFTSFPKNVHTYVTFKIANKKINLIVQH